MINHSDKTHIILDIVDSISQIVRRYQAEDDEEKQWLIQHSPSGEIKGIMEEMSVMMLSVLDAIGNLEPVNGITVSKQVGISKGSVSKVTRKLIDKQLILIEYLPNNKKEVLFRTTELGKEIHRLHHELHQQINAGVNRFLHQYTADELQFLASIMRDSIHTSWLQPESDQGDSLSEERVVSTTEDTIVDVKATAPSADNEDAQQILALLSKLDSRDLKKARTILTDVFVTEYNE